MEDFNDACKNGNLELVKELYNGGFNIMHAFRIACENNHFEIVKWLHSLGADIHSLDEDAFIYACENGHFEIAKWLHSLGADIHVRDEEAFILTCANGYFEIAKWLHSLGVNIHVRDEGAFRLTCRRGHFEITKWLHNLDKSIIANSVDRISCFDKLGIDDYTINLINILKNNESLPDTIDYIDDCVIYIFFKKNRIADLERLDIPYVSYDVINDKIVNPVIRRLKSKSARNII